CRNGDEFACDKLVRTYNFGDEGIAEQNLALTVDYAHNGCVYNAGYSCYIAGYYLMTGAPGINKNVDEAQKHLERGCELNSAESCYNLSTLLTANHEFAEVSEAIKNNYQKACELNLYEGCAGTGYVLAKQQNFSEAVVWYTKACDADNMGGCKGLAEIYSAAQNTETSRKFSQKACDLGDQESCDYVKEVDKYLAEIIAYEKYLAQQEEKATQITNELKEGDYSRAMDIAVNELASRDQAARVIMATENAGKISSIPQVYFYNLMNWFVTDYQQAGAIVNRELRAINESNRASQNQIRVTPTPRLNSSSYLSEAADKFYKDSYQRNLNRYIQGGNPSDVRVGLFLKR
ncbi:MAG TPA: tetratricopeptide repeat protein, partial [Emcibacteraceae bacterium]|nr:tetratricopeptide repeat protein [Emcibacteraceae bacterium]